MIMKNFMTALSDGQLNSRLGMLYGSSELEIMKQKIRLLDACEKFSRKYPFCDDIAVVSVPTAISIDGIPMYLSADKLIIRGIGHNVSHVSDHIPKGFRAAKSDIADVSDCFAGYSLCFSGVKKRQRKLSDTDYGRLCEVVYQDAESRAESEREAIKRGDTAEFFRLFNNSPMFVTCSYKTQTAVIRGRKFLGDDGAVSAENGIVTAFVPSYLAEDYSCMMNELFGDGNCIVMKLRSVGELEIVK